MKRIGWFFILGMVLFGARGFGQSITVIQPNGGEMWTLGSQQAITWQAAGVNQLVRITLWRHNVKLGMIADNQPASGSFPWSVGAYSGGTALAGGGYKVRIRAVGSGVQGTSAGPFGLENPDPLNLPDLVIQSLNWEPKPVVVGQPFTITCQVANIGVDKSRSNPRGTTHSPQAEVRLYVQENQVYSTQIPPLCSTCVSNSVQVSHTLIAPACALSLRAVVDITNQVKEQDETNNELHKPASCLEAPDPEGLKAMGPDLVVREVYYGFPEGAPSGKFPDIMKKISFNFQVRNLGHSMAKACKVRMAVTAPNGIDVDSRMKEVPWLPKLGTHSFLAGDDQKLNFKWGCTLTITADWGDVVKESDENNNTWSFTLKDALE